MNAVKLIVSIGVPLLLGAVAGMFTAKAVPEWYATLNQPSFSPPGWIFGPVWTALYILMGISLFLLWRLPSSPERNTAMISFAVQLILNFGWSFLFFYYKMIGLAFIEIILIWIAIVVMMILFYRVKPLAMWLNVPYLLWVSFASVLNGAYYVLNR